MRLGSWRELTCATTSHLRFRHDVEVELGVDEAGAGLGHVALVGAEAGAAEAAGAAQPVHPLGPLGVQPPVRLLVLRLEDADRRPLAVLDEVAPAAPLVDPLGVDARLDRLLRLPHQLRELGVVCKMKMSLIHRFQTID